MPTKAGVLTPAFFIFNFNKALLLQDKTVAAFAGLVR